jgi:hypothetical protein
MTWTYGLLLGHDLGWFHMDLAKLFPFVFSNIFLEKKSSIEDFSQDTGAQGLRRKIPLKWLYNIKDDPSEGIFVSCIF